MSSPRSGLSFVLTVAAVLAAAGLCSCAKGRGAQAAAEDEAIETNEGSGTRRTRRAPTTRVADKDADDLRKYIDQHDPITEMDRRAQDEPREIMEIPKNVPVNVFDDPGAVIGGGAHEADGPIPPMVEPAAPPAPAGPTGAGAQAVVIDGPPGPSEQGVGGETPEARLTRQITELRQTIHEMRTDGDENSAEALELLALGMLKAEGVEPEIDAVKEKLTVGQRRSLSTLQTLLAQVREGDGVVAALDARRLSRLLTEHGDKLADQRPLRIISSALCTSVQSFGSYTKFPDYTFLQGRTQPVIVYVALENFSQREAGAAAARVDEALAVAAFNLPTAEEREKKLAAKKLPNQKAVTPPPPRSADLIVELTESIAIHNDADDLVVWKAPEASIRDVSRDRRKDYYLVQRLELPARLTLGKYTVKVTVRDVATGATDEAFIPIEIVADPALASAK